MILNARLGARMAPMRHKPMTWTKTKASEVRLNSDFEAPGGNFRPGNLSKSNRLAKLINGQRSICTSIGSLLADYPSPNSVRDYFTRRLLNWMENVYLLNRIHCKNLLTKEIWSCFVIFWRKKNSSDFFRTSQFFSTVFRQIQFESFKLKSFLVKLEFPTSRQLSIFLRS